MCIFDQSRNINHSEASFSVCYDTEIGNNGCKRIVRSFCFGIADSIDKAGFPNTGRSDQRDICQELQLQIDFLFFSRFTVQRNGGKLFLGVDEVFISCSSSPSFCNTDRLSGYIESGYNFFCYYIFYQRSHRNRQGNIRSVRTVLVFGFAGHAFFGFVRAFKSIGHQCVLIW